MVSAKDELLEKLKERADKYMEKFKQDILSVLYENSSDVVGIFASYSSIYSNGNSGEALLDRLARRFVDKGFAVLTGKGMYYKKDNGEIVFNDFITHAIDTLSGMTNDQKKVLKFFATIVPKAVFLLHGKKGAMGFEDDGFSEADGMELGLGFVRIDEPLRCGKLMVEGDGITFFRCTGENSTHCSENRGLCPFYEQARINHTSNLMYVTSPYMFLVVVSDYDHITDVSVQLFRKHCALN